MFHFNGNLIWRIEKKVGTFAQGRGPQFCKQFYAFFVRTSPYILPSVKHKVTRNALVILSTILCQETHVEGLSPGLSLFSMLFINLIPLSRRHSDDTESALLGFGSKFPP